MECLPPISRVTTPGCSSADDDGWSSLLGDGDDGAWAMCWAAAMCSSFGGDGDQRCRGSLVGAVELGCG